MTAIPPITGILRDLNASLPSTLEVAKKLENSITPPQGGLSLLDTKNELLLSYIQNIVFLILLKIRNAKSHSSKADNSASISTAVEKLVELRLYLEKGVRPLEEKLRFQIEKALRAADDAERSAAATTAATADEAASSSDDDDGSDGSDEESDSDNGNRTRERTNARPALSNMNIPKPKSKSKPTKANGDQADSSSLPYRPPKNRPVMMPASHQTEQQQQRANNGRNRDTHSGGYKSRTIDEFVSAEYLHNPMELPSIGTTIANRGRSMKTARQRAEEEDRQNFEETNLVRLPKLGKKEQAKQNKVEMKRAQMNFGGEEWRDLDQGVRRIETLTQKKKSGPGGGGGFKGALDRSRKRGRDTVDGPRGSGVSMEIGERFNKKLKVVEGGRRDRGKKR